MSTTKQWKLAEVDSDKIDHLSNELKVNLIICRILVSRGIETYDQAKDFFRPQLDQLHSPFMMRGMEDAVSRISTAVQHQEKIRIFGDYDVDGTTSVAIVYNFLKNFIDEQFLSYYIPNRYTEGYGLSKQGIEDARNNGCNLMIILDCGIQSVSLIAEAKSMGIDVIVCDHHIPGDQLPDAIAILNPKQKDCKYPFKELSACGIGFKLICALTEVWDIDNPALPYSYIEYVAASIASDIVPIVGENRILAYYGLKKINEEPSPPFRILKDVSGIKRTMNISNLVFFIGPKINAAGRMKDAKKVVQLFTCDEEHKITELAKELNVDNQERISVDKSITNEALAMMEDPLQKDRCSTVLHNDQWHKGVVGIVASRIQDQYYRPTIILTTSNGMITGSARSVHGFDIHHAIGKCSLLLVNYGGHQFAAGLTMYPENLPAFQDMFEDVVSKTISEFSKRPILHIDAEISFSDINRSLLNILEQFEPCGPGNMMPLFSTRNVKDSGGSRVVKNDHLQLYLEQDEIVIKGIAFGKAEWLSILQSGTSVDIVYHIERNEWNGVVSVEIRVIDIRISS